MSLEKLKKFANSINVASELSDDKLMSIGNRVLVGFKEDQVSMEDWLADVKLIEELSSLKSKKKNTPLPNSANIKLPIITKACYEFSSATYPEIINDDKVVLAYIMGKDFDGTKAILAKKCTDYMNYQLLFEQTEWELELDRLLNRLALIGFVCKKTYYDPIKEMVRSVICNPSDLIINASVTSLDDAPRVSEVLHLRLNDFISAKNKKVENVPVFLEQPVEDLEIEYAKDELDKTIDIIEQHCNLDLDEDGYAEPYIVTVLKEQGKVLRIAPRFTEKDIHTANGKVYAIDPIKCFVDFHFLVSPKGKFQSVGFGSLLLHINESANSVINQLVDAGQLANMQGGYKDARLKLIPSGNSLHDPGEWKDVKVEYGSSLKEGIVPIAYKEPSSVLYQLLGLLIDVARDLTASAQINNGTQSSENAKTGATVALQNEGKKTINSINKRIYRSLTNEFRQIFDLNGRYLDKSIKKNVIEDIIEVSQEDFDSSKVVIFPIADPTLSSDTQRIRDAQFVQSIMSNPGIDPVKATKFILEKSQIADIEKILVDESKPQPPNPEVIKIQADIQNMSEQAKIQGHELALRERELQAKEYEIQCNCLKLKADAILSLSKAGSLETGNQMQAYIKELDLLSQHMQASQDDTQRLHDYVSQQSAQQHEASLQASQQAHEQDMAQQEADQSSPDEAA